MRKSFQIKITDLLDVNAKWIFSLCTTFSFFELSHECATIINLCEVTETFENQDFKQRIWLIKRGKCKRPSVQYVLFDIIAQVPSKSFGIRHIVSIDTCTQFYCVFHLFNRIFYFSYSSALVYFHGKFMCVYRRKADQAGSWKNADIIECWADEFKLFDSRATDDFEASRWNHAQNTFVWTFFHIYVYRFIQ